MLDEQELTRALHQHNRRCQLSRQQMFMSRRSSWPGSGWTKGGAAVRVVEDGQRDGQLQAIEADGAVLRQPHGNQRAIADLDARRARVDTCPPPTQQEVPAEQAADVHVEEIKLARQRMDEGRCCRTRR
mmetsp:Transcript_115572/g.224934  ORF Transcript_115572/g.224934 Transcript_115572/m.224934 type:complete len:129 (+) Transcript_115572:3-389(+)